MTFEEAFSALSPLGAMFLVLGLGVLAVAALPRLLHEKPISFPIPLVLLGMAAFALPLRLPAPDPLRFPDLTEHLTELVVIVALTNAGLKLDRRFSPRSWSTTWRLLAITMPLTVIGTAVLGWWVLGLAPASAALLGAVVSPTDPVLAAEVQVGGPGQGSESAEAADTDELEPREEDEVRFALTSEAGLNDGLAFPYTNLAIAMALAGADPAQWFGSWFVVDLLYKVGVGFVVGLVVGRVLARIILALPSPTETGKAMTGVAALAVTFAAYGGAEFAGGYGFLATFVAAYVMRHSDSDHEYHEKLVVFVEQLERMLIVAVLLLLGGAVVRGALSDIDAEVVLVAALVLLVVRPLTGLVGLVRGRVAAGDRFALAFFGIRGVGSFYYLAFALNEAQFDDGRRLWTVVVLIALMSIFLHGMSAPVVLAVLDRRRMNRAPA